ncbi:MAG: DUF547 domain-containing protein [Ferruginibacter sp.]
MYVNYYENYFSSFNLYMKFRLSFLMLFFTTFCSAQAGYKTGETIADIPAKKILNFNTTSASIKKLQANVTIIDFFGTWCLPCIKALPELAKYKKAFNSDLNVILVSTEDETKLSKFINSRQPFAFPLVVDEGNTFTNAFQPPSYPYTVVIDKNLKILAITNAADLTEVMLQKFISESKSAVSEINTKTVSITPSAKKETMATFIASGNSLVKLSQDFMYAAKTGDDATQFINQLKDISYADIISNIKTDDDKKAFWINLYNAYTNSSLHKNPDQYKNRSAFFKNKNIIIAGKTFSLDEIEHGILRRSKIKWSLGYLNKLFPGKTEKELRVDKLDYRIHFALNCGAKSCPPIAFYNPENIDKQLDVATTAYLTGETAYDKEKNTLALPALFNWFRRDFGGKKKIIALVRSKQLIPAGVNPKIMFKKYDWSLYLDNFKQ